MGKAKTEWINVTCCCGYETGLIDVLELHKTISKAGGITIGKANKREVTMESSVCPKCKRLNTFDVIFIK